MNSIEEKLKEKSKYGILVVDIDPQTWDELDHKYELDENNFYILYSDALEILKDTYSKDYVETKINEVVKK